MDYLYYLQTLRESAPDFVNSLLLGISEKSILVGVLMVLVVYWCIDKRAGEWMLLTFGWGQVTTDFIKIIACVPRPWLRDPRLHLAEAASSSATGYSFPSGHTSCAATSYGTAGAYAAGLPAGRQGKRLQRATWAKVLAGVFFVLVLLVAFARNWLGAHTLADVCVGLAVAAAVAIIMHFLLRWVNAGPRDAKGHEPRVFAVAIFMLTLIAAGCMYAHYATFPVVYDMAGNPIDVDNYVLITDLWKSFGMAAALVISWVVERTFINFSEDGTTRQRIARGVVGVAVFALFYLVLAGVMVSPIESPHLAGFLKRFISFAAAGMLVPAIFKWVQVRGARKAAAQAE